MTKAYVIKNINSGEYFTRNYKFDKLAYNTKMYESYRDAYKELEIAKNNQIWDLLEKMFDTDRFHIDTDIETYNNVAEHVIVRIKKIIFFESETL